jgi:hypothetical protein
LSSPPGYHGLSHSIHSRLSHPHSSCKQLLTVIVRVLRRCPTHHPPYKQWLVGLVRVPSRSSSSPCHRRALFLIPPPPVLAVIAPIVMSCHCCWPPCSLLSCPGVACCCGPAIPPLSLPLFIIAPPVVVPCFYPTVGVLVVAINTHNLPCEQWLTAVA